MAIIIESTNSFSNFFVSMNNHYSSQKNVYVFKKNSFIGKVFYKLNLHKLNLKIFKTSISTMPMFYAGLGKKNYFWIHDALTFEEEHIYGDNKERFEYENKELIKKASIAHKIITPTEFSKNKLIHYLKCDKDKIIVLPCQLDEKEYFNIKKNKVLLDSIRIKYNLNYSDKHLIFIGSPHFRKNLKTTLQAFRKIKKKQSNCKLLVVSYPRRDIPNTLPEYEEILKMDDVVLLQKIPREDIISLICIADVLVNPTFEEGFGLPNVEAQMCGTPVVSSNISCIPEVLKDSSILIDPKDSSEISKACIKLLSDKLFKSTIIQKGYINKERFNKPSKYSSILDY